MFQDAVHEMGKSRLSHDTTVRTSSTSMIQHATSFFGSVVQVLTNSAFPVSFPFPVPLYFLQCQVSLREKMMPNSLNFRELRVVLLEQVVVQKTFPEVPIICVSCGNPESRQGIVLGLGTVKGRLRTWDALELLAVSES